MEKNVKASSNGQFRQFLATVVANMPDIPADTMQGWIQNPRALKKVLLKALTPFEEFKVWKTIKLGGFINVAKILEEIKKANIEIDGFDVEEALQKISLEKEEKELDLVILPLSAFEMKVGSKFSEVYRKAEKFGLEICPAEVVLQLLLQYEDKSRYGSLYVITKTSFNSRDEVSLFEISDRFDKLSLYGYVRHEEECGIYDYNLLFVLPREK